MSSSSAKVTDPALTVDRGFAFMSLNDFEKLLEKHHYTGRVVFALLHNESTGVTSLHHNHPWQTSGAIATQNSELASLSTAIKVWDDDKVLPKVYLSLTDGEHFCGHLNALINHSYERNLSINGKGDTEGTIDAKTLADLVEVDELWEPISIRNE